MKFIKKYGYTLFACSLLIASIIGAFFVYHIFGDTSEVVSMTVGHLSVKDSTDPNEVKADLVAKIETGENNWKDEVRYILKYQNIEYNVDIDLLDFDANKTYSNLRGNQRNLAYFDVNEAKATEFYEGIQSTYGLTNYDKAGLVNHIMQYANSLTTAANIDMYEYVWENGNNSSNISSITLSNVYGLNMNRITKNISNDAEALTTTIEIKPGKFSVIEVLGRDYDLNDEQLSIIATGLAKVILRTSFNYMEYRQSKLRSFSDEEFEFMVLCPVEENDPRTSDFVFYNPETYSFYVDITHTAIANTAYGDLTFVLRGLPFINRYVAGTSDTITNKVVAYSTIVPTVEENSNVFENLLYEYNSGNTDEYGKIEEFIVGPTAYQYTYMPNDPIDGRLVSYSRLTTDLSGKTTKTLLFVVSVKAVDEIVYSITVGTRYPGFE